MKKHSVQMEQALTKHGIDHIFKPIERMYHGYGLGSGCMAEGWLEEAIAFWKKQMGRQ